MAVKRTERPEVSNAIIKLVGHLAFCLEIRTMHDVVNAKDPAKELLARGVDECVDCLSRISTLLSFFQMETITDEELVKKAWAALYYSRYSDTAFLRPESFERMLPLVEAIRSALVPNLELQLWPKHGNCAVG
jgi:hypothetical protein